MELLYISIIFITFTLAQGGSVGVNYGRIANNLPSTKEVVDLIKAQGIERVKIFDTDPTVLGAFSRSGVKLVVDLPNELLSSAASRPTFALNWVRRNIARYYPSTEIEAIAVGNEVFVDPKNTTRFLVQAMRNVHDALVKTNLSTTIKVSTPIALSSLQNSYPPSSGSFKPELVQPVILPLLDLLRSSESYLMVNAYPFFAYEPNSDVISLDYALFRQNSGLADPTSGRTYYNLLDAQLDAVFSALSALKYDDLQIVVSETGWPSKGDENEKGASVQNAAEYNRNLIRRVLTGSGTPLRPTADLRVYLFALFNEDGKKGPTSEKNYGLFFPDKSKVYDISFTVAGLKNFSASWCLASDGVSAEKLQAGLSYACGEGGADCRGIQKGGSCYQPNDIRVHASYAFNSFYQKNQRKSWTCDFDGIAYVSTQPPKFGTCVFPTGD